jgi:formylglycine-generating enzyme required for sulfatase activity
MDIRFLRSVLAAALIVTMLLVTSGCQVTGHAPPAEFSDCEGCPVMVVIPAGHFQMGSAEGEEGRPEGPIHEVTIGYRFAVGKFEVTYAQFSQFVQESGHAPAGNCTIWTGNKWEPREDASWRNPGHGRAPLENEPVSCVSWNDAKAYVNWLSGKTGERYRLPSEAEWEYVARAGTSTRYYWGDSADGICTRINLFDQSGRRASDLAYVSADCDDGYPYTAPVGSFAANPFGLYDVIGNVWEWTEDCYAVPYPPDLADGRSHQVDGDCERRSIRGGGWITSPARQRAAFRGRDPPGLVFSPFGLRVARDMR